MSSPKQQTLKKSISIRGIALHTGFRARLTFFPAEVNSGIIFRRADLPGKPTVRAIGTNVTEVRRGTTIQEGDAVGTLCWNHYQHLECYFGIPIIGSILHTLNLRLHPDDLEYIINDANDQVIIVDASLLPILDSVKDRISPKHIIVITDGEALDISHGGEIAIAAKVDKLGACGGYTASERIQLRHRHTDGRTARDC